VICGICTANASMFSNNNNFNGYKFGDTNYNVNNFEELKAVFDDINNNKTSNVVIK
jgi:hypothetical protein